MGNIPIHRIPGLQEACVISNIWSFFPKPMKAGPHLWTAFCTVPRESWNTNARWRHTGTGAGNCYLYAQRVRWWMTGIAIPQQLHKTLLSAPTCKKIGFSLFFASRVHSTVFCAIAEELQFLSFTTEPFEHINKNCLLQSQCVFTSHLQGHTYMLIARSRVELFWHRLEE